MALRRGSEVVWQEFSIKGSISFYAVLQVCRGGCHLGYYDGFTGFDFCVVRVFGFNMASCGLF